MNSKKTLLERNLEKKLLGITQSLENLLNLDFEEALQETARNAYKLRIIYKDKLGVYKNLDQALKTALQLKNQLPRNLELEENIKNIVQNLKKQLTRYQKEQELIILLKNSEIENELSIYYTVIDKKELKILLPVTKQALQVQTNQEANKNLEHYLEQELMQIFKEKLSLEYGNENFKIKTRKVKIPDLDSITNITEISLTYDETIPLLIEELEKELSNETLKQKHSTLGQVLEEYNLKLKLVRRPRLSQDFLRIMDGLNNVLEVYGLRITSWFEKPGIEIKKLQQAMLEQQNLERLTVKIDDYLKIYYPKIFGKEFESLTKQDQKSIKQRIYQVCYQALNKQGMVLKKGQKIYIKREHEQVLESIVKSYLARLLKDFK